MLGIALTFIIGLPALNHAARGENDFRPGEPYVINEALQIVPADGWQLETSEFFTTFKKNGASLIPTPPVEKERTGEEWAQWITETLEGDTTNTWVIGSPQTFVTNVGDHGVSVTAHSPTEVSISYYIYTEDLSVSLAGTSPDSAWASVADDMDAMAASVQIIEDGQS